MSTFCEEEAVRSVGPYDPHGLEIRVHRNGADEPHPASPEVLGYPVRQIAPVDPVLVHRPTAGPSPDVFRERTGSTRDIEEHSRIPYGGDDLRTVPDDPGIGEEPLDILVAVSGYDARIESVEGLTECIPLVQDALPREPRLEAFQEEHLIQLPVVMHRDPPFPVMVLHVSGIGRVGPDASPPPVGPFGRLAGHIRILNPS